MDTVVKHDAERHISSDSGMLARIAVVVTLVIVIVGVVGNLSCIVAFLMPKQRRRSSSQYLLALAFSDLFFLLSLFVVWLRSTPALWYEIPLICNISAYVSYVSSFQSAWYLVAFSAERFVAVYFPLKRNLICSVHRARVLIALNVFASIVINLWVPHATGLVVERRVQNGTEPRTVRTCDYIVGEVSEYEVYYLNIIDTVLTFVVPATLILTLNAMVAVKLWLARRVRAVLTSVRSSLKGRKSGSKLRKKFQKNSRTNAEAQIRTLSLVALGTTHCHELATTSLLRPRTKSLLVKAKPSVERSSTSSAMSAKRQKGSSEARTTQMLLLLSGVYLLLNLPSYVARVLMNAGVIDGQAAHVLIAVTYLLFYSQYSVNFILYSVHGRFRCCMKVQMAKRPSSISS